MFKTILVRLARQQPATPGAATAAAEDGEAASSAPADEPRCCGWFDSSHALQCGLLVTEHASPDAVANDLPLADWLAMQLAGWHRQPAGAVACAA